MTESNQTQSVTIVGTNVAGAAHITNNHLHRPANALSEDTLTLLTPTLSFGSRLAIVWPLNNTIVSIRGNSIDREAVKDLGPVTQEKKTTVGKAVGETACFMLFKLRTVRLDLF